MIFFHYILYIFAYHATFRDLNFSLILRWLHDNWDLYRIFTYVLYHMWRYPQIVRLKLRYQNVRIECWFLNGPVGSGCTIHRLHHCSGVRLPQRVSCGPVGWGCTIHRLHHCSGVRLPQRVSCGPVGWGCTIHRLHHCSGVRLSQRVSWYMTLSNLRMRLQ